MNYIAYPICIECKHPILLSRIYVNWYSSLMIQYTCKCKCSTRTLDFNEYLSELLYYENCHSQVDSLGYLIIGYCFQCNKKLNEFCIPNHQNHTLMHKKYKRILQNCRFHGKKINYFCINCSKGLCSHYRKTIHSCHTIMHLKDFYNDIKLKVDNFQKNYDEYFNQLLNKNPKYKNKNLISSLKMLFKLFIDCFNSKIGIADAILINNVRTLFNIKSIELYPFLIKKPVLNR